MASQYATYSLNFNFPFPVPGPVALQGRSQMLRTEAHISSLDFLVVRKTGLGFVYSDYRTSDTLYDRYQLELCNM